MRVSQMILQLQALQAQLGDVEVLVTDGFDARCYRGDYEIIAFDAAFEGDGFLIDIGIGGCLEE
jgi:hypothetical protein